MPKKGQNMFSDWEKYDAPKIQHFWKITHIYVMRFRKPWLSTGAHLAFLQFCNTVSCLQEDKCIFVGCILTFTHVRRTTKNPLIYFLYPTSDFTAPFCSKVQYDKVHFFIVL